MFVSHGKALKACRGDLRDPAYAAKAVGKLLKRSSRKDADFPDMILAFLRSLPPRKKMKKIVRRLKALANTRRAVIKRFRWWQIMPGDIALCATLKRDGQKFDLTFCWKTRGRTEPFPVQGSFNGKLWRRNGSGPWMVRFEDLTYARVKIQFFNFLRTPLASLVTS